MAKQDKQEKPKIATKKYLARQEREEIQTRRLLYIAAAVFAVVVILVTIGLVDALVLTPNRPVATVNGDNITTEDYVARARYDRLQLVNQYMSTFEFMQGFGDESTQSFFMSSLQQIIFQLTPEIHGQTVLDSMIDDVLIQQEAERLGITVTEAEIDERIEALFGYFPNGTPTPVPTNEPVPTSTLNPQQLTLVPPVPTEVITETVQEPEAPAEEVETEPTEVPPTPTAYTADQFEQDFDDAMLNIDQNLDISEKQFREIIAAQILGEKVAEEMTKDTPTEEDQVWARHILVETEAEALEVIARLDAGEDFADLASELSQDSGSGANGGDLGWFSRGQMVAPFEEAAFALEIGEVSDPVQSDFGFHVIQKLGHELRPVDQATQDQKKQAAFNEWLAAERESADIETFADVWGQAYPNTPIIPPEYLINQ